MNIKFTLDTDWPLYGDVYLVGKMNNYDRTAQNKMVYNKKSDSYEGEMILKQGFYNYQYIVKSDTLDMNYLEGNHFETENDYEVLAYYRPMNLGADLLVGYTRVTLNSRN